MDTLEAYETAERRGGGEAHFEFPGQNGEGGVGVKKQWHQCRREAGGGPLVRGQDGCAASGGSPSSLGRGPRGEQTARFVVCAAVEALPAGFCVGRTSAQHPLPRGACLFPANFCLCPETFSCSGPPIFQQERWEQGQLLPPSSPSSLSPLFLSPADSQQTREGLLGVSIRMKWFGPDCITRV